MDEEGIPLFSVNTSTLIFVEAVVGTSLMQLDHERFHEVEFVVCLSRYISLPVRRFIVPLAQTVSASLPLFIRT